MSSSRKKKKKKKNPQALRTHPQVDDTIDSCAPRPEADPPSWAGVWPRLHDLALDRDHRILAWRLLHGSLWCGAFQAYIGHRSEQLTIRERAEQATCPRPGCQGTLETLSHMLLDCPTSMRVWTWVAAIWRLLSDGAAPPLTVAVLLADDDRVWQPQPQLQSLWTRLRLAVLFMIFTSRRQRRLGLPTNAPSIAARVLHNLRSAVLGDWHRVSSGGGLAGLSSGVCCSTWLRGRHPLLTLTDFRKLWGPEGVLYKVTTTPGARPKLDILWSVQTPVPIPTGGQV